MAVVHRFEAVIEGDIFRKIVDLFEEVRVEFEHYGRGRFVSSFLVSETI